MSSEMDSFVLRRLCLAGKVPPEHFLMEQTPEALTGSLVAAARSGNVEVAKVLIANGADVKRAVDEDGMIPLVVAAYEGHLGMVRLLLKEGADPRMPSRSGMTPLMAASASGLSSAPEIVKELLKANAPVDQKGLNSYKGWTALMTACKEGRVEAVKMILDAGATMEVSSADGCTARSLASKHRALLKTLLLKVLDARAKLNSQQAKHAAHSDPSAVAEDHNDAIGNSDHVPTSSEAGAKKGSSKAKDTKKGKKSPDSGADKASFSATVDPKAFKSNGKEQTLQEHLLDKVDKGKHIFNKDRGACETGVMNFAVESNIFTVDGEKDNKDFVNVLPESVDGASNDGCQASLEEAAQDRCKKVGHMRTQEPKPDPSRKDSDDQDAGAMANVMTSSGSALEEVPKVDRGKGSEMPVDDKLFQLMFMGQTAEALGEKLVVAALLGHVEVAEASIANGADVKRAVMNGMTPLVGAADKGHLGMVCFLLKEGADPRMPSRSGMTPLMAASASGLSSAPEIVKELLKANAPVDQKGLNSYKGWTALMTACKEGRVEAVKLLLDAGATMEVSSADGCTARSLASKHRALLKTLLLKVLDARVKLNSRRAKRAAHSDPSAVDISNSDDLLAGFGKGAKKGSQEASEKGQGTKPADLRADGVSAFAFAAQANDPAQYPTAKGIAVATAAKAKAGK